LHAVIDNLKKHYVDPENARRTADALLAHEKNGDDEKVADGGAFANLLTKQIRDVSHDMHLEVVYSQERLPDLLPEATAEDLARYRKALEQDNCTFSKVEILPHNIGYLKLNAFPDPLVCRATATAARGFFEPRGYSHLGFARQPWRLLEHGLANCRLPLCPSGVHV
jgi:hypothetical protein